LVILGAVVAVLLAPRPAHADAPIEAVQLEYRAHKGCPPVETFLRWVRKRAPNARIATESEPARTFTIVVQPTSPEHWEGTLRISGLDGGVAERQITARSCRQAVSVLALIAAVAIDPRAEAPLPADTEADVPEEPPPVEEAPAPVVTAPTPPPAAGRWRWSLALSGGAAYGVSPRVVPVGTLSADLAREKDSGVFLPAVRLSVGRAQGARLETGAGDAAFDWTAAGLQLCPFALAGHSLRGTVCATFDAGILRGQGSNIAQATTATLFWAAPGAAVRVGWTFVEPVFVEAQGAATFPLRRATFAFDQPSRDLFQVPWVSVSAILGVGIRFP
jgi:hypothetical protein